MTDVAVRPVVVVKAPARRRHDKSPRARRGSLNYKREQKGFWFTVPFGLVFLCFLVTPLGYAIYMSLYSTKLVGGTTFSGFANYSATLESSEFWGGFVHVIIFAAVQIPVMLVLAFFFATMFDLGIARFGKLFRAIFFLPYAVPAVVGSLMWSLLYAPGTGPYSEVARDLGFGGVDYFSSGLIIPAIIVIAIWEWTGFNMLILYTALKSVSREVVEAAVLDGISVWRVILHIKLPMVRPVIVLLLFVNVIGASQLFTEPQILSYFQANAISNYFTPTIYIYNTAIAGSQYNLAAAAAVVLAVVVVILSVVSLSFRRRRESMA